MCNVQVLACLISRVTVTVTLLLLAHQSNKGSSHTTLASTVLMLSNNVVTARDNQHHSLPGGHGLGGHGVPGGVGLPCQEAGSGRGSHCYQQASHSSNIQLSQMCTAQSGHRGSRCGSGGSILPSYSSSSMLLPCSVVEGTE